jgi:NAD(P)-dependent dehydrogenase (short-subunit alcohol dehydrogenase family)
MSWHKDTVLITGASRGIGAALALELAGRSYPLALTYRSGDAEARAVAQCCRQAGAPQADVHRLDLLDNQSISQFTAGAGEFAVLAHNAAIIDWTPVDAAAPEAVERVFRSNVEGPLKLTAALLKRTRECMVFVGSDVAIEPHPQLVAYSASKAALRAAALALSKGRDRPRILIVHPTRTATAMNDFEGRDPAEVARAIADVIDRRSELASGTETAV